MNDTKSSGKKMMQKTIAFVYFPHFSDRARLETMPYALNSVSMLANAGWQVELYLWEGEASRYNTVFPKNVTIINSGETLSVPVRWIKNIEKKIRFQWRKRQYCCVFGVGQIGAHIAHRMAKSAQCPFVYINDEFPSHWAGNGWLTREQQAAQNAAMIIVLDSHRLAPLRRELSLDGSKPFAVLPNIPLITFPLEDINWHKQFRLPADSIPFLYTGGIGDWVQIPEILSSVPYWPERAVLILNGRSQYELESYRRQLSHLEIPGKVFWSAEPMPEDRLNSLVAYCMGNFALYRNTGANIEHVGFSSGKLMRSLACGGPVIASTLSSLSFVEEHSLGVLVRHPVEIPDAIEKILQEPLAYKKRCVQFCTEHAGFEKAWNSLCVTMKQATTIDLQRVMN